ncbi:MAG: copper amine oxidase [Syntrophomonadaceae bacterium]|nr:copper amine oxidase [Syntrophomonadaceae bacterium]
MSRGYSRKSRVKITTWIISICLLLNIWFPSGLQAGDLTNPEKVKVLSVETLEKDPTDKSTSELTRDLASQPETLNGTIDKTEKAEIQPETPTLELKPTKATLIEIKTLAPGIEYNFLTKVLEDLQPVQIHYLKANLNQPWVEVRPVISQPMIGSLETLTNLSVPYGAIGAVNGSFYYMGGQRSPIDTTIIDQQLIVKSSRSATSLFFMTNNKVSIDQFLPITTLKLPDKKLSFPIKAINRPGDGIVLYTPLFEPNTNTESDCMEMVLKKDARGRLKIREIVSGNAAIPPDGAVISFQGSSINQAQYFNVGDTVTYAVDYANKDKIVHLLGNGPLLVKDGRRPVPMENEGLESALWKRHPRTAVGLTKKGEIMLVVVEGRQENSVGMTFEELADLMLELGADKAMAMDGGGSAEMLVKGQVINHLTDGRERKLSNGIVVIYQIPVYIDDQRIYFELTDGLPVIENDRVLVPARKIFETMGIDVAWDEKTSTVTAVKGKTTVKMKIGSNQATVKGKKVKLDVSPKIIEGRTMIPLRFISQSFRSKVEWKTDTRSAYITTKR